MNRLYISDLDGTLLNQEAALSTETKRGIQKILEVNILFTVATARSVKSVQKMFEGIHLKLPVIEFNGAFITELNSGEHLVVNAIEKNEFVQIKERLDKKKMNFLISSFDGEGDHLYYTDITNEGEKWYIHDRKINKDPRLLKLDHFDDVLKEDIICITIIDRYEKLKEEFVFLQRNRKVEVHIQENHYSPGWYWLTIHSHRATKDKAIKDLIKLKNIEPCTLTVFGDNTNDIKMMKSADRGVAVSNAIGEVKDIADEVIQSNLDNGVLRYILEKEKLLIG